MAKPRSRDSGKYRIYVSDRSGFEFGFNGIGGIYPLNREAGKPVQDVNTKVSPEEFDTPPPSKRPLGGEGEISNGNVRANSNFDTPSNVFINQSSVVVSVLSSTSVAWNQYPWTNIAGGLSSVTMAVSPQVVAGNQSQQVTLMCVSNQITFINGSGLGLRTNRFVMTSGSILNLMYQSGTLTWLETSRSSLYQDLGSF